MKATAPEIATRVESQPLDKGQRSLAATSWYRIVALGADYGLVLILIPVGATILMNRLPWSWVLYTLIVVPLTWLARWVAYGRPIVRTPIDVPILFLILTLPAGIYASVDLELSKGIVLKFIMELALFYAVVHTINSKGRLQYAGIGVMIASAGLAIISLLGTNWSVQKVISLPAIYEALPRLVIRPLNPEGYSYNIVGGTMAMLLPLSVSYLLFGGRTSHRLVAAIVSVLVGVTLFLSKSRGAWIGTACALMLLTIWKSRWFLLSIPTVGGGILLALQRLGTQTLLNFALVDTTITSAQGRGEIWSRAIYMLQDFPFTGIGIGTFGRVAPVLYPYFLIGPDADIPHAHNLILQAGVDFGLPGLVAYVGLWCTLMVVTWQSTRRFFGTELYPLPLGLFCGFVAYHIHGLTDAVTAVSVKAGSILWVLIGVSAASWIVAHNSQVEELL